MVWATISSLFSACSTAAAEGVDSTMADDGVDMDKVRKVHWVPLESNPDMLNEFARKVGLPAGWEFVDVFGVDPELLCMVPAKRVAVTLLFQSSDNIRKFKEEQKSSIESKGQTISPNLTYLKQYVGNACGTIACIHSLTNNAEVMGVAADSAIGKFGASIKGKTPKDCGLALVDATELHSASEASAAGGQTAAPEATADIDAHFICFVEKDGDLYELDGAKAFPINHGPTNGELLETATRVIKANWMDKDPDNINFNMMALVQSQ
eukprot:TRINITY_DN48186_c0_g1_i1.p1 TRINITY_DN48186_c0_g1~~TRINITY_DN48186_c0_g1_i1.p1  ORF type:complete len:266 (+),score=59.32 TRINITY_DN48186_c0_g1_i1:27-824(+)